MRLLQRYILFELLRVFGFVLSVSTVLLVFVGIFQEVSENGLGPLQVLQILPFVVPSLLPFTIPATLLLTVCVVYGRMAGDREIIAAKAAGINVLSLLWPSFVLGSVLSVCSLLLTDQVIPWAVANIERTVTLAMEDILLDMLRTQNQVHDRAHGITISVLGGVEGKKLIRPTFRYSPHGKNTFTMQAREATLKFDLEKRQVLLHMVDGYIDAPGRRQMHVEEDTIPFPLPNQSQKLRPRHLSIERIRREITRAITDRRTSEHRRDIEAALALATGNFDRWQTTEFSAYGFQVIDGLGRDRRLRMEMHNRFAMASSCFFFVLFGSPFAILMSRKQFLTSFLFCFLPILLVYYPVAMLMMNLSKTGTVNPLWAMWVGNLLLLAACGFVFQKVLKH